MRLTLALLLLSAGSLSVGCSPSGGTDDASASTTASADMPPQRVVRVEAIILEPTDFEDVIQITGTLEAPNDATLSAQSGGTLEEIRRLGSRVGPGTILARLDDDLIVATLEQMRAQVEVAEARYALADGLLRRQEPLYRDSIISVLEFENVRSQQIQAQAELARAEATVRQVEKQLENTLLRAPFAGTVEEHFLEKGEQVLPGVPVLRIVNTNTIRVAAGVPERYASDVATGSPVRVRFQASGGAERSGLVAFASSVIDPENRTFRIEVALSNSDGSLKPAMIVNLFITRARLEDRLVLPQTAVMRDEVDQTVFVVLRDSDPARAARRRVTLGASYGGSVVVESGLQAGDEVIVVGNTNVTEGDAVAVDASPQAG